MAIDITAKSKELKDFVSQYESTQFLGEISSLFPFIRFNSPMDSLNGLSSPQRQLLYLIGLNISSEESKDNLKHQFTDEDFDHMKTLLTEIEEGYEQFFYPRPDDIVDEDWEIKRRIAMPTFLSYFNQGLLNYEEQIIERIQIYFEPFEGEIAKHFGLSISDFIDIYNFIDDIPNGFLNDIIHEKEEDKSWLDFTTEMRDKGTMPFEWHNHLPEHFKKRFNFIQDKGSMYRFTGAYLKENFDSKKIEQFLSVFNCERQESGFLYYTEPNLIYSKPIFKVSEDEYQSIDRNSIIQSIFNVLFDFCIGHKQLCDRFYKHRGKMLENKIVEVIQRFYKNKAQVFQGFFTQDGHEQDLLFLSNGIALIIEAKSSKRDEPRREPEKAYPLIVANFNETIQKGYDQTYRVKSKFIDKEVVEIYSDQELLHQIAQINPRKYFKAFSIVVTLERFGQIQTDLSEMLNVYEEDDYPWSICIDDLETFILILLKQEKTPSSLSQFLSMRELLHGNLLCSDELEVCGAFLSGNLTFQQAKRPQSIFALTPDLADIFDYTYENMGLGFRNEKNLDIKTSGKHLTLGGL